jgi:hypothetical protein
VIVRRRALSGASSDLIELIVLDHERFSQGRAGHQ